MRRSLPRPSPKACAQPRRTSTRSKAHTRSWNGASPATCPSDACRCAWRSSHRSVSASRSTTAPHIPPLRGPPPTSPTLRTCRRPTCSGPTGCPTGLPADACPTTRATVTTTSPYSPAAPLPADLVVPLRTIGSARGIRVLGTEQAGDREVVHVETTFDRAAPMFPFLRLGGTWRPLLRRRPRGAAARRGVVAARAHHGLPRRRYAAPRLGAPFRAAGRGAEHGDPRRASHLDRGGGTRPVPVRDPGREGAPSTSRR